MSRKVLVIVGHPDPGPLRYGRVLAQAYAEGARAGGHEVHTVDIAQLEFPLLRSQEEWNATPVPETLRAAHEDILWADHLLIFYPLWLGDVPAKLKGFLEQVLRPGKALSMTAGPFDHKPLSGKSARVVITMGMPAWIYRWVFGAHSLKSLKRNVLWFVGIGPVRHNLIGMIEDANPAAREAWIERMRALGRRAA